MEQGALSFSAVSVDEAIFCEVVELALKRVCRVLPEELEPNYINFLSKYLRACLRGIAVDGVCRKIVFTDTRRHIYFYGSPKKSLLKRIAHAASRVTILVFVSKNLHRRRLRNKNRGRGKK